MRLWVAGLAAGVVLVLAGLIVYERTVRKPVLPGLFMGSLVSRVSDELARDPSQSVGGALERAIVQSRDEPPHRRRTVSFALYYNPGVDAWVDEAMLEETVLLMCVWDSRARGDGARALAYTRSPVQPILEFIGVEVEEVRAGLRRIEMP